MPFLIEIIKIDANFKCNFFLSLFSSVYMHVLNKLLIPINLISFFFFSLVIFVLRFVFICKNDEPLILILSLISFTCWRRRKKNAIYFSELFFSITIHILKCFYLFIYFFIKRDKNLLVRKSVKMSVSLLLLLKPHVIQ